MREHKTGAFIAVAAAGVALALAACSGPSGDPGDSSPAGSADVLRQQSSATTNRASADILTINVILTDDAFQPSTIFMPAGQRVRLVVRNQGQTEHHFHIEGLVPQDMFWAAKDLLSETDLGSDLDSHGHQVGDLVPFHMCTSRSGLCPTGKTVHAHAMASDLDIILFTPADTGTYRIVCPLHPNISGSAVVF